MQARKGGLLVGVDLSRQPKPRPDASSNSSLQSPPGLSLAAPPVALGKDPYRAGPGLGGVQEGGHLIVIDAANVAMRHGVCQTPRR